MTTLDAIEATIDVAALTYTGEHEDFFFLVQSELERRLGVETAGKLHTGRSRNDIDHTVFKMALKERLAGLLAELLAAIAALLDTADANRATLVVAYTHGQPAQPTTYGHYLGAVVELLLRDVERLRQASRYPDLCSMGAAAITTSGFPLDRAAMAELLGFAEVQENAYGCIAANDYVTSVYGAAAPALRPPRALRPGPQRLDGLRDRAPVGARRLRAGQLDHAPEAQPGRRRAPPPPLLAGRRPGRRHHRDAPQHAVHRRERRRGRGPGGGLRGVRGGRPGAAAPRRVHPRRPRGRAARPPPHRRELHHGDRAGRLAGPRRGASPSARATRSSPASSRACWPAASASPTVPYSAFAEAFEAVAGRPPRLSEADLRQYTTPEHFIAVRTLPGGPAPAPLAASLARYRAELDAAHAWLDGYRARLDGVDRRLADRARALVEG